MYGLDLFSGIGGLTKALDGYVRPVAYCEIEPYARGVLLSRMHSGDLPLAPIWDDVSTLRGAMLPHVDIVYGGFPCQDISTAGKQIGLGGERSSLFFEIVRLASETKAEWLFLENVSNIRTKGLGRVLKELDAGGYDCRWGLLSAADVGANHKRERWFLLGHHDGGGCQRENISIRQPRPNEATPVPFGASVNVADSDRKGWQESVRGQFGSVLEAVESSAWREPCRGATETKQRNWWTIEPNVGRVANGIPKRVDRLRALGNAVVPAQAREAFERLLGVYRA